MSYPVVETAQKDNICHLVMMPANISKGCCSRTVVLAAIASLTGLGIYGVEPSQR